MKGKTTQKQPEVKIVYKGASEELETSSTEEQDELLEETNSHKPFGNYF